ncbi:MAG: PIG-L deacetylase family protein [Actinomycetota bacterium]|nr:PIG-L deacetylase family protein [Actinomycetota bacterium]
MPKVDPVKLTNDAGRAARFAVKRSQQPVRKAWQQWVRGRGTDETEAAAARSCLVIAPHPDDETIGCGATIARKRAQGTPVRVVVVTDGRHSHPSEKISPSELAATRRQESVDACTVLGVDPEEIHNLGYEEGTLWRCLDHLAGTLARVIDGTGADEILVVSDQDWHTDHRAVHHATLRAIARSSWNGTVGAYPVWYWADGPWRDIPIAGVGERGTHLVTDPVDSLWMPAPWLVSTDGFADLKREAFGRYTSQTTNLTGEDGWATFAPDWIDQFLAPSELFFPVTAADVAAAPSRHHDEEEGGVRPRSGLAPVGPVDDDFLDDRPAGTVVGSEGIEGATRGGIDAEGTISIDDGALRFTKLRREGWGRQAVSYGPFTRRAGLALSAVVLNGHNTARTNDVLPEGRKAAMKRVVRDFPHGRLVEPVYEDNLCLGFFGDPAPSDPTARGNGFVMHAAGVVDNGELQSLVAGGRVPAHRGVKDLPIQYVVVLGEHGAVTYAMSVPGAAGVGHAPELRPVAVDRTNDDPELWAVITQPVNGEVNYRADTRVHHVRVDTVDEWSTWCASAITADRFRGEGDLDRTEASNGATWRVLAGTFERHHDGLRAGRTGGVAMVDAGEAPGLVAATFATDPRFVGSGRAGLVFRGRPDGRCWRFECSADTATLSIEDGDESEVVASARIHLPAALAQTVQVIDTGTHISCHVGGTSPFGWVADERLADGTGIGVVSGHGALVRIADLEAHPRAVQVPPALALDLPPVPAGDRLVIDDGFDGPPGELGTSEPTAGAPVWVRALGDGIIDLRGDGTAAVRATAESPNPGRTIWTAPWHDPTLADLEIDVTPPGTAQHQGHGCRAGVVFWQDEDNHLIINAWLDDSEHHNGSAVSQFFVHAGAENMYDAVWSNVGRTVRWGQRFRLRAANDGRRTQVWLNGEPVLHRALRDIHPGIPPLAINRVGLVVNREWRDDTGSVFHAFRARGR